jgi:opacity protein-like surface antigen
MKKIALVSLMALFVAPSYAQDMYAGLKLGSSSYGLASTTAIGGFFGYHLNEVDKHLSVEGEVMSLGSTTYLGTNQSISSFGVNGVYSYPIDPKFSVFGKAGLSWVQWTYSNPNNRNAAWNGTYSSLGLNLGAGAEYKITPQFAVRGGYDSDTSLLYAAGMVNF